jgi:hypothetical protein
LFITLRDFNAYCDVYEYLRSHLSNVQIARHLPASWPSTADLDKLAKQSEGIFIYASTLIKFVNDEYDKPQRKLQIALKAHNGLDTLFEQVLGDAKKYPNFELALGAVIFARNNPRIRILALLLQLSLDDVRLALRGCLSILLVPEDDKDYIRPYHASLQDFLTDSNRGRDRYLDPVKCNMYIVDGCIQLITSNSTSDSASLHYAHGNWGHHLHLTLSYAQDLDYIQSHLAPRVEQLLKYLLQQLKTWFCSLRSHFGMREVYADLNSSLKCTMVS